MKKQLLIAAVAATMASAVIADVSITGAAQINYVTTDFAAAGTADTNAISHDMDLKVTGANGATTAVMDFEMVSATGAAGADLKVKNAYMTTSVAGINIKAGSFYGGDSLLGNGTSGANKISLDTTVSGVKVQYEDNMTDSSFTMSGSVAGVALSHEIHATKTDSKISGSIAGVSVTFRSVDADSATGDQTSTEVSTTIEGVTLSYVNVDADASHTSDAFFGDTSFTDATGYSAAMSLAGNKVTVKAYDLDNVDYTKVVVNRPLANGTTFEAVYTDTDASSKLDLELAVKF
jgi:hypothetical protein